MPITNTYQEKYKNTVPTGTKLEFYLSVYSIFLSSIPNPAKVHYYIEDNDKDAFDFLEYQEYIGSLIKPEYDWMTITGIIETVDLLVNDAHGNCNIFFTDEP